MLFLSGFVGAFAQAKFYAKGNANAYIGKTYAITFVLENGDGRNFNLPQSYPGFDLIGGPSQSSNYSWVNGKSTSSKSFTYYLQARKEGVFYIPVASVVVGKETLKTTKLKVLVKKGNTPRQTTRNTGGNKQNTRSNTQASTDNGDWEKQISKNLFVKMYTDNSKPFAGQQVTLYLKLYQRIQTFQTQVTEMPEFKGFWVNDFTLATNKWEKEELDGVWYNTMMINKYALFPQRAGDFVLSPIKLETVVQIRSNTKSNSIWDQFFGRFENKKYPFQSNGLKIKVKPLPTEGIPENFSGAVGNFKYSARLDSLNVKTGSALTLRTRIVGTGNVMMIEPPNISLPEEFEVYDPQEKEYISKKSTYINGSKKYDYLMIPNKPGEFVIEPIPFSFFDLATKKYKTIHSKGFTISVTPSADYVEEVVAVIDEENALGKDIKTISSINDLNSVEDKFISTGTFWTLWASPAFVFFLLLIGKNKMDNYDPDFVAINRKKANKLAMNKLKDAQGFLSNNDTKGFYNEIVRALWDYVSLKLNIQVEDLSKDNIQEKLLNQNVSDVTAESYIKLIEKSEMAVYSPIGESEMQKDYELAKEIIINVEGELS